MAYDANCSGKILIPFSYHKDWGDIVKQNLPSFRAYIEEFYESNTHIFNGYRPDIDGVDLMSYLLEHELENLIAHTEFPRNITKHPN